MSPDRVLGWRRFTDGRTRPVFLDAAGKQYVQDDDGERVPGVWLYPPWVPSDPPPAGVEAPAVPFEVPTAA
jgi:hypothetical protein